MDDFFSGRITYKQWFEHDISEYKKHGANRKALMESIKDVRPIKNAKRVIEELRKRGYRIAVISGSLDFVVEKDFKGCFDYVYVNRLSFDGKGEISSAEATPFDMEHKATGLKLICTKENITPAECIFVGDHFNDVQIAKLAGLSIAFNPKVQELEEVCDHVIKEKDLALILRFIPPIA
jgi:phosphoserine phosphatase